MKAFQKKSFIIILIGFIFFTPSYVYAYDLNVDELQVTIKVKEDNTLDIEETIDVKFNRSDMHGIFRDLPLETYFKKPVNISNIKVHNYLFTQEKVNGQLRLKIGDPSRLAKEREVYKISYTFAIGDDRNITMDELYFNIVGTSWEIPISRTSFIIIMPKDFNHNSLNFTYGDMGSTTNEDIVYSIDDNTIRGSYDHVLYPGQGLTLALPLPEGYFSDVQRETYFMDYVSPLIPFISLVFFILGFFLWFRYGKPGRIIATVEFYPPKNLSPMEIGYIYDKRVDTYDLTAMLIYWADAGYIKFKEIEVTRGKVFKRLDKTIQIEKLKELPNNRPGYELLFFKDLFNKYGNGTIVKTTTLENSFYITLGQVSRKLIESFKKDSKKKIVTDKSKKTGFFLKLIGFIGTFLVYEGVFYEINPYQLLLSSVFSALFSGIIGLLTVSGSRKFAIIKSRMLREKISNLFIGSILVFISILINGALILYIGNNSSFLIYAFIFQIIYSLAAFSQRHTQYGEKLMNHLTGLKSFIEHAEKDRINLLVESDPEYFYHLLPYAMILGVTDKWARRFESIAMVPPSWYESPYLYGTFNALTFTNYLNENTKSISQSMSSSPSSSGASSGGGMSGGGSGGGGGGGW